MLRLNPVPAAIDHNQSSRSLKSLDTRISQARSVFRQQAEAISALGQRIDERFDAAVELLIATPGHVIIAGMGKSGLIGQKMAATFASTGTPSFFVHPADAYHGDLGMITDKNTVILISYSGETQEVLGLLPHLRQMRVPVIGLVGGMNSTLAREVDVALDVSVAKEACPNNLAPTSSTLAALAMGDALTVALIHEREFGPHDFAKFHPGGSLARRLCHSVADVMRPMPFPVVGPQDSVRDAMLAMAEGATGRVIVVDRAGKPLGVFSDAELRRALDNAEDPMVMPVSMIMGRDTPMVEMRVSLGDADARARQLGVRFLLAVDDTGVLTGIVEF